MTPQHMQQLDIYHEQLVRARWEAFEPNSWGVVSVSLDARALRRGRVTVEHFEGVLPDGTVLSLGPSHPELPASRPTDGHFPASQSTLDVYCGVPREREGVPSYCTDAGETNGVNTRFLSSTRPVFDLLGQAEERDISFAQRNVVILFGGEPRDDFETIKIAELVRDDAERLAESDRYVVPCLRVSASPFLRSGLRRLLTLMENRRRALSEARRERDETSVEYHASDVTRFLLLHAICGFVPIARHLLETGDQSPRIVYLALSHLIGQLSSFSTDPDAIEIPPFVYTDLRSTFEELFAIAVSLLHASTREHCIAMPLEHGSEGMFVGSFADERLARCRQFFLGIRSALPHREVAQQLPRICKVASWQDVHGILAAATPGAAVQVRHRPPPQVPIRSGVTYFSIETDNPYWKKIVSEQKVAVYLPMPFVHRDTHVELIAVIE